MFGGTREIRDPKNIEGWIRGENGLVGLGCPQFNWWDAG